MYHRHISDAIMEAWRHAPVVLLEGARQCGKTTLIEHLSPALGASYQTLDDATVLAEAAADPQTFIQNLSTPAIIDEVQLLPELFRAIKLAVDRQRRPGMFFLTGSANIMLMPRLSESLAGRMEIVRLWTLSQGEIEGKKETFLDSLFQQTWSKDTVTISNSNLLERVVRGGYPEAVRALRPQWFASYIRAILQRDVKALANIDRLTAFPDLLSVLAARVGGLLNVSDVSATTGVPNTSMVRYLSLLEGTFQIIRLKPWSRLRSSRFTKSPKFYLTDTGLACHLLGASADSLTNNKDLLGRLVENFVLLELLKQAGWSKCTEIYHFRTNQGIEVDFVAENQNGQIAGIEVKLGMSPNSNDLRGLKYLEEIAGSRFKRGIILHGGEKMYPITRDHWAVPISALWR